jgi:hypothetical protein
MRTLTFLLTGLVILAGCTRNTDGALRVIIKTDAPLKASCVELQVLSSGAVLASQRMLRQAMNGDLQVAVKQGDFPADVRLQAFAYTGLHGEALTNCGDPSAQALNSKSAPLDVSFPPHAIDEVQLQLAAPDASLDADRDGYAGNGGPDCNDNDASIAPGTTQVCSSSVDTNCDGRVGCNDPDCNAASVCQRAASLLAFTQGPATVQTRDCSGVFTVESRDSAGATAVSLDTVVSLSATDPAVRFYAATDSTCSTSPVTQVMLRYGEKTTSFRVSSTKAGTLPLTAAATGLTSASTTVEVTPRDANSLSYNSSPQTLIAGACSDVYSAGLYDAQNVATTVAADTAVTVTSGNDVTFFAASDTACATPATAFTILKGSGVATFRLKATRAGAHTVSTRVGTLSADQTLTVNAAAAAGLAFVTTSPGVPVDTCSAPVTIQVQDVFGNKAVAPAAGVAVHLSASTTTGGHLAFFSDSACNATTADVSIAAGLSEVTVRIKGDLRGPYTMQAADTNTVVSARLTPASQGAVINMGPPVALIFPTSPTPAIAHACSAPVRIQTQDASNSLSSVTGATLALTVTTNGTGVSLFSDATCTTALGNGFGIPVGASEVSVYFSSDTAQAFRLTVSSALPTVVQDQTVRPAAPSRLAWSTPVAQSTTAGVCSPAFTLNVTDAWNNPSPFPSGATLTLSSSPAGLTFSTAANCGSAVSSLPLGAATTSVTLYGTDNTASTYGLRGTATDGTLTASAPTSGGGAASLLVNPGLPTVLNFNPAPSPTAQAGDCKTGAIERRDSLGNLVTAAATTSVSLSTDGTLTGVVFSAGSTCGTGITTLPIPSGAGSAAVSVKTTHSGSGNLIGSASGVTTNATAPYAVSASAVTKLVFNPVPASSTGPNGCVTATVERRDTNDNPVLTGVLPVGLSSSLAATVFYAGSACSGGSVTSVSIPDGASQVLIAYQTPTAGTGTITASSSGLTSATAPLTVNTGGAAVLNFSVLPTASVGAGTCATATLERRDTFTNLVTSGTTGITLGTTGSLPGLVFYAGGTCTAPGISSVNINPGASTVQISFKSTQASTGGTVTGTASGFVTNASAPFAVGPAGVTKLVFNPVPTASASAAQCVTATVERRDTYDNVVVTGTTPVTLASTVAGTVFSLGSACGTPATAGSIPDGSSTLAIAYQSTTAGTGVVTAASTGLTTASAPWAVTPLSATKLNFVSVSSNSVQANVCVNATAERRDTWDNLVTLGATTVTLGTTGTLSGVTFYTGSGCSSATGTLTIVDGTSSVAFSYRTTVTGVGTVTGSIPSGTVDGSAALTVTPFNAVKVVYSPAPASPVTAGACTPLTIVRHDTWDNLVTTPAHTVNLAGTLPGLVFYNTSNCMSGVITSTTIPNGSSSVLVYFRSTTAGSGTVTATGVGGSYTTPASASVTVNADLANKLVLTSSSVTAGVCTPFTVATQDQFGNAVAPLSALTVTLSTDTSNPLLSAASDCSASAVSTTTTVSTAAPVTMYFKGTTAETAVLTGAGTGVSSGTSSWAVSAAAASKLVWKVAPSDITAFGCSPATIQVQDPFGNVVKPAALQTLTLTSSLSAAGAIFMTSNTCTGAAISTVAITTALTEVSFGITATGSGSTNISTTGGSLGAVPADAMAVTASAGSLAFTTAPTTLEYRECQAFTVTRKTPAAVAWTKGSTTVTVASSDTSITVHAAAGCAAGGASSQNVTIADGASTGTVYLLGHSSPSTVVSVTAVDQSSLFNNAAPASVTALPLVRTGSVSIAAGASSGSTALSPSLPANDISRSFLLFSAQPTSAAVGGANASIRCQLVTGGNVSCDRGGTTGAVAVNFQVVSFGLGTGVSVTRAAGTLAATTTTTSLAFPSATAGKSLVLFSTTSTNAALDGSVYVSTGSASNFVTFSGTGVAGSWAAEVVNFGTWATVDRNSAPTTILASSLTATDSTASVPNSALLISSAGSGTDTLGCSRQVRAVSAASISFSRGNGTSSCNTPPAGPIAWQRLIMASATFQTQTVSVSGTSATATLTAVVPDRTFVLLSGQGPGGQAMGENSATADGILDASNGSPSLSSTTQLTLSRVSNAGTAIYTAAVIQLPY